MRRLLVLFALLGLLFSPAVAAAAQQACAEGGPEMAGMAMPAAATADPATPGQPDPCCDHGKTAPDSGKACAQACATMCGVVATLPTMALYLAAPVRERVAADVAMALKPHPPPGTERPPRPIA
jgi:hypothetical protein